MIAAAGAPGLPGAIDEYERAWKLQTVTSTQFCAVVWTISYYR